MVRNAAAAAAAVARKARAVSAYHRWRLRVTTAIAGSWRSAAAIASRCAVSATRILAARIAGETPTTAAPAGTAVARCDRIRPAHVRAAVVVASAVDPTPGAPSAVCRKVTIRSFGVAAGCDAGLARDLGRLTSFGRANDRPRPPTTA